MVKEDRLDRWCKRLLIVELVDGGGRLEGERTFAIVAKCLYVLGD